MAVEVTQDLNNDVCEIRWSGGYLKRIREGSDDHTEQWELMTEGRTFYFNIELGDWPQLMIWTAGRWSLAEIAEARRRVDESTLKIEPAESAAFDHLKRTGGW